jgi:hypothetical protein
LNKITYLQYGIFAHLGLRQHMGLLHRFSKKNEFLKIFISPGLDRGRGRDGDENFFLQIFFFIAITTAIKTAISTSKFFRFFARRFFSSAPPYYTQIIRPSDGMPPSLSSGGRKR